MTIQHLPIVKIIKVGTICSEASEIASTFNVQIKSELGIGGGSTVTLIKSDRNILVDTGFEFEWLDNPQNNRRNASSLRRALKDHDLTVDDIDMIFITHWHRDHFGNLGIFRKAKLLASKQLVDRFGLKHFTGLEDGQEIVDGVRMILTPGHTAEHASVIVDSRMMGVKARIAIAGDAIISHSYFQSERIWKANADFFSASDAKVSMNKLIKSSDIIIPGHGVPFLTK